MNAHASQPAQDPRIGTVLQERYRIVRKLGDGGMGSVYEGEHILIKKRVAIKVLHSQFAQNPEIVARFHREAEAATSIGHPNIVEVTDMGRFPDGTAYMVLEFLQGRDWSHDIEHEGPQPLGKVIHILSQVCDALAAAHAKGIVHRDLKPENIFLIERAGDPSFAKVLDFGISKIADATSENRSLTQTGTALGTPYYMAPEQCQGKKDLDARADIYSLGVILFQALTHQYPFDDESYPMLVLKICTEPPPPLQMYRPDLPPAMYEIVNRMLAKDRSARFASCDEVKAALAPFRHIQDAPVMVANAPSTASRGPSVLEHRASGPVSTPTATAYLPSSPDNGSFPEMPAAHAPESRRSSSALWAVLGFLVVLVVAGGALGTMGALGVFSSRPDDGVARGRAARDARAAAATPVASAPSAPLADPAPAAMPAPAAVAVVPTTPPEQPAVAAPEQAPAQAPAQATVPVSIRVLGPPSAQVFINGQLYGTTPFQADLPRDDPPTPGQPPVLHRLEVRAEGWQTVTQDITFLGPVPREISMQRVGSTRGTGRSVPSAPVPTPGPQPLAGTGGYNPPPAPPPVRPQPQTESFRPVGANRTGSGTLVGSGTVF